MQIGTDQTQGATLSPTAQKLLSFCDVIINEWSSRVRKQKKGICQLPQSPIPIFQRTTSFETTVYEQRNPRLLLSEEEARDMHGGHANSFAYHGLKRGRKQFETL